MLAVIYINKQVPEKLINHPEINCSMSTITEENTDGEI
jgi:hypothetical protein